MTAAGLGGRPQASVEWNDELDDVIRKRAKAGWSAAAIAKHISLMIGRTVTRNAVRCRGKRLSPAVTFLGGSSAQLAANQRNAAARAAGAPRGPSAPKRFSWQDEAGD